MQPVLSAASAKSGMSIGIKFSDGDVSGTVSSKSKLKKKKNKLIVKRSLNKDAESKGSLL